MAKSSVGMDSSIGSLWPSKVAIMAWPAKGMRTQAARRENLSVLQMPSVAAQLNFTNGCVSMLTSQLQLSWAEGMARLPNGRVVRSPEQIICTLSKEMSVQCHNLVWMLENLGCVGVESELC